MTEVVRHTRGHPILQLATTLRERLANKQYDDWEEVLEAAEGEAIYRSYTQQIMMERYCEKVRRDGLKKVVVITHSNNQAYQLNLMMRQMLYGNYRELPQEGEVLMVSQNHPLGFLSNGDRVRVERVGEVTTRRGIRFVEVSISPPFQNIAQGSDNNDTG